MYYPQRSLIPSKPGKESGGDQAPSSSGWRKRSAQAMRREHADGDSPLKTPFEHARKDFHHAEHDALNAELFHKLEMSEEGWREVIGQADGYINRIALKNVDATDAVMLAIANFKEGYFFTNQPPIEDINQLCPMQLQRDELLQVTAWPRPEEVNIRLAFHQLLKSDSLMSNDTLKTIHDTLSVLDKMSRKPMSDCSIAMHERHHTDLTMALREELQQGAAYLTSIDKRIALTRELRSDALASEDYQKCQDCFQEEVTMGADLVALNLQRMSLFDDAEKDADAYCKDIADLLKASDLMARGFRDKVQNMEKAVGNDVTALNTAMRAVEERKKVAARTAGDVYKRHIEAIEALNGQEALVWKDIVERMGVLKHIADERKDAVAACVRDVERSSAEMQRLEAEWKALRDHMDLLKQILDASYKALSVEGLFSDYVIAMKPLLLEDCNEVNGAIHELKVAEVTSVLTRYDCFADTTEECKQRSRNRLEGLQRLSRERALTMETIKDTYDPVNPSSYEAEAMRCDYQISSLEAYLEHLEALSDETRKSVEPALLFALQTLASGQAASPHHSCSSPTASAIATTPITAGRGTRTVLEGDVGLIATGTIHRSPAASPKQYVPTAHGDVQKVCVDLSRHPQLAAAVKALSLEAFVVDVAAKHVDEEQLAVGNRRIELQAAIRKMRLANGEVGI